MLREISGDEYHSSYDGLPTANTYSNNNDGKTYVYNSNGTLASETSSAVYACTGGVSYTKFSYGYKARISPKKPGRWYIFYYFHKRISKVINTIYLNVGAKR